MVERFTRKFVTIFNLLKKPNNIQIDGSYFMLKNITFDIDKTSNVTIEIGRAVKLSNVKFYIRGINHSIKIGDSVRISGGVFWIEDNDCVISIGSKTTVEFTEFACTEPHRKIIIGEDCMFSSGIELRTGDSHSIFDLNSNTRVNFAKDIIIGDKVWVGAHSKILKGANIESNVIIGTSSIVTGDNSLKANSIYVGIPARCIKSNVTWNRRRVYI